MCSLFEEACLNGDFECIIKLKIDLNLEKGFYNACKNGHYNIVKYLLNNFDINYNYLNKDEETCIEVACMNENISVVKLLLKKTDIIINPELFSTCCLLENNEIIKILLEHDNIDCNYVNKKRNYTPLMISCEVSNESIVNLLLKSKKVDINKKSIKGDTAFNIACQTANYNIINMFLNHENDNINYNIQNNEGFTPFISYCINNKQIYEPLLDKFIDNKKIKLSVVNNLNKSGYTYLKESMKISTEILIRLEMKMILEKELLNMKIKYNLKFKELERKNYFIIQIINCMFLIILGFYFKMY